MYSYKPAHLNRLLAFSFHITQFYRFIFQEQFNLLEFMLVYRVEITFAQYIGVHKYTQIN